MGKKNNGWNSMSHLRHAAAASSALRGKSAVAIVKKMKGAENVPPPDKVSPSSRKRDYDPSPPSEEKMRAVLADLRAQIDMLRSGESR